MTPRNAEWFKKRYNVDIHTSHEVQRIDHKKKRIYGLNLITRKSFSDDYDALVFATGSIYNTPAIFSNRQFENVFQIKNVSSGKNIHNFIKTNKVEKLLL